MTRTSFFFLTLTALLAIACSKTESSKTESSNAQSTAEISSAPAPKAAAPAVSTKHTCRFKNGSMCSEWSSLEGGEVAEARDSCKDDGVFGKEPCPTANLIATCEHKDEKMKMFLYKSTAIATLKDAREICEDGVFTAAQR